jgi:hypothetical protein
VTVCQECNAVEPKTREASDDEIASGWFSEGESVCCECGSSELKFFDEDAGADR